MLSLVVEIIGLALGIVQQQFGTTGGVGKGLTIASALERIVAAAVAAYHSHVGQPLDVSSIQPYVPIGQPTTMQPVVPPPPNP